MKYDSRELNLFVLNMIQLNWPFLFWIWFKRMELLWVLLKVFSQMIQRFFFRKNDWKNWTFFNIRLKELNLFSENMTQRIEPFVNMTERIELFSLWLKEWNLLFSWIRRDELNHFLLTMTDRIELFLKYDSKNWTFFLNGTQRFEPSFEHVSMNWTFFLNNSTTWASSVKYDLRKYDSKNWHLFLFDSKKLNFFHDVKNLNLLFNKWLK